MLVKRELYALDQPLGKLLLRDGFTLVSSAIGDEELGSALLPDITGSSQILVESISDTESAVPYPSGCAWLAQRSGGTCSP